ncbi:MAG TPA: hypothetical protein VG225_16430 [Terracidiphilus sp.]|jgi:hypothetical protein|nr:hypothetical protein [Terracidiphilus sp.]
MAIRFPSEIAALPRLVFPAPALFLVLFFAPGTCFAQLPFAPAPAPAFDPSPIYTFASQSPAPGQSAPQEPNSSDEKKKKKDNPSAISGSPGHIFWVIPAYKVDYQGGFKPLTPKEKFHQWAQDSYDPLGLTAGAVEAGTLEYSSPDGFCGYGHGFAGYGKCFGSLELDSDISSFIGDYVLTVALHQDPRYFRLGKGSFGTRVLYTVSRVFITYNDQGRNVFYSSAITGTVAASAISNLYYPSQDVGFGHTMSRIAIDLGNTELFNGAAEFWPDIHHALRRAF